MPGENQTVIIDGLSSFRQLFFETENFSIWFSNWTDCSFSLKMLEHSDDMRKFAKEFKDAEKWQNDHPKEAGGLTAKNIEFLR